MRSSGSRCGSRSVGRERTSRTCSRRPEAIPPAVPSSGPLEVPHGTTVLGLRFAQGIVMAGDRRATAGYAIADAKMKKVFAADDYSAIAIAGAAGQAVETVRLFQLELEHYEKLTGDRLSLEGKANRLAQMIRANFPLALQGLVVVPLFSGPPSRSDSPRVFPRGVRAARGRDSSRSRNSVLPWPSSNFHAAEK